MANILPLDKQQLPLPTSQESGSHGRRVTKPALDSYWSEDVNFLRYQPPPSDQDEASLEEWSERLSFLEEDLHWLLKQPHHKFWSQVVFDETLQHSIDSYLHHAPRPYDPIVALPENLSEKHQCIHRLIFMVCLRMATYKESKEHFITPAVFGDILYGNFLFDIVKIMELCVLYGGGNGKLLSKMVDNIFTQQPSYNDDLKQTIPTILEVLDKLEEKCGKNKEADESLKKLGTSLDRHVETMTPEELQDVIFYIMDTAQSINAFLEIYPQAAVEFHQKDFVSRVASFYEVLMPELENAVKKQNWESQSLRKSVKVQLRLGQAGLAQVCGTILSECCIKRILESGDLDGTTQLGHIDNYLELITSLLSEKHFMVALCAHCHIEDDIDLISQSTDQIDETRTQFVLDGVKAVKNTRRKRKQQPHDNSEKTIGTMAERNAGSTSDYGGAEVAPENYQTEGFLDEYGCSAVASNQVSGIELDSLISAVKDLFPVIGDGFIEACLEEYNYDSSKVINDILEDNLSPNLQDLDRSLQRSATPPPPVEPDLPAADSVFSKRANIYENDEFDVFTRDDVDTSKIHKGKREEMDTALSILADKSNVKELKAMYNEYSYEYEDEYDDTYDANDVGAGDADSADELFSRSLLGRPLTTPRILEAAEGGSHDEEDQSEEEDQYDRRAPNNQAPRSHQPKHPVNPQARQTALQGQQKGKGQNKNTQKERNFKDKHKSSRANHNRKAMADKKRRGGMGPLG